MTNKKFTINLDISFIKTPSLSQCETILSNILAHIYEEQMEEVDGFDKIKELFYKARYDGFPIIQQSEEEVFETILKGIDNND